MRKETREIAKESYERKAKLYDRPVPTSALGWFIKFHFTDEGQIAIWNAKAILEDVSRQQRQPEQPADHSPEQLDPGLQSSDQ